MLLSQDSQEDTAKIIAAVHGDDRAMDDIPFFSPAGVQAWRAYHCRKRLMLVSLVSDEDFARISAALLCDDSAMDHVPCFSSAGAQAWRAYHYLKYHHMGAQHRHCDCHLSHITEGH
jgi:hypothetical protein